MFVIYKMTTVKKNGQLCLFESYCSGYVLQHTKNVTHEFSVDTKLSNIASNSELVVEWHCQGLR